MLHPRTQLGYGMVNGEPLFLDLNSDSYFALDQKDRECFLAHRSGATGYTGEPECEDLACATRASPPPIAGSVLNLPEVPASPLLIAALWRALRLARRDLARVPLADLVEPFLAAPEEVSTRPDAQCITAAHRIARARTFVPQARHCLTDSLAIMRLLAAQRAPAMLVFGAKLDPFAAHCWVQSGTMLLNDHVDTIRRFTPVLTVPTCSATR